jgi:hypothetical protein
VTEPKVIGPTPEGAPNSPILEIDVKTSEPLSNQDGYCDWKGIRYPGNYVLCDNHRRMMCQGAIHSWQYLAGSC